MKTLTFLRHATADWDEGQSDLNRPLSRQGRAEAEGVGRALAGTRFDLVLCSTAARTRETLALLNLDAPTRFERVIYEAAAPEWMQLIAAVEDEVDSILLVGHMPSIVTMSLDLTTGDDGPFRQEVAHHYPPASLATMALDIDHWHELRSGCGRFTDLRFPA